MRRLAVALFFLALLAYCAVIGYKIHRFSLPGGEVKIPESAALTIAVDDRPSALLVQSVGELVRSGDLELRIVTVTDAPLRWQKLAAGEIDLALGTLDSFTLGAIRQKGMALVADTAFYSGSDGLIVPGSCRDFAALAGKKIALVPGSSGAYLRDWILEREKLSTAALRTVPLETGKEALSYLLQGRADGAILWEPYRSQALKKGFRELASSQGSRIVEEVLAASANALAEKRARIATFLGAWFQLQALLEKNTAMAFELLGRKTSLSPDDLTRSFNGMSLITLEENQGLEPEKLVEKMKLRQKYWVIKGEPNASLNTDFDRAVNLDVVRTVKVDDPGTLFGESPSPAPTAGTGEETPIPEPTSEEPPAPSPSASATASTTPSPPASPRGAARPRDGSIYFALGSFELDGKAVDTVRAWIAWMKEHAVAKVVLRGYADVEEVRSWSPGRLAESRARRVQEEMTRRGIDEARIEIKAEGLTKELVTSASNRRVDVELPAPEK